MSLLPSSTRALNEIDQTYCSSVESSVHRLVEGLAPKMSHLACAVNATCAALLQPPFTAFHPRLQDLPTAAAHDATDSDATRRG